jgi:hypothetical protein
MPKMKFILSDSLKQQFPFIKQSSVCGDSSTVECAWIETAKDENWRCKEK